MKRAVSTFVSGFAAAMALGFSGVALAASTWDFGTPCDPSTCTVGGVTATVSGYGSTGSGAAYTLGTVTNQGTLGLGFDSNGSENSTAGSATGDHAFDNRAGGGSNGSATNEMLLISFGTAKVALTAMATGWSNTDSDISILRWDGAGAPDLTTTAGSSGLAGKGWTLISSKDVDGIATKAGTIGSAANDLGGSSFALSSGIGTNKSDVKVSSWWLISTYFGATDAANNLDNAANDFFKVLSFTGNVCTTGVTGGSTGSSGAGNGNGGTCGPSGSIPEPGSMALAALAILGAWGARRRSTAVVSA